MMSAGPGMLRARPGRRASTLAALGAAAGAALAGAVVWGLVALLIHRQLSLIGLAIGVSIGSLISRFRPGHLPTIVGGAAIAVAGCALGTFLGQVFLLLRAQISLPVILTHLNLVLRAYPANVGVLGILFYALAAFGAVRVPLRSRKLAASTAPAGGTAPARGGAIADPGQDQQPEH